MDSWETKESLFFSLFFFFSFPPNLFARLMGDEGVNVHERRQSALGLVAFLYLLVLCPRAAAYVHEREGGHLPDQLKGW